MSNTLNEGAQQRPVLLAGWLLEPADRQVVKSRQEAVTELRPRLDLRERLAVLAEDARTGVDADSLAAWGEAPPRLGGRGLRLALWACTLLGIAGAAAGLALLLNLTGTTVLAGGTRLLLRDLFLATLVINGWFYYRQHQARGRSGGGGGSRRRTNWDSSPKCWC